MLLFSNTLISFILSFSMWTPSSCNIEHFDGFHFIKSPMKDSTSRESDTNSSSRSNFLFKSLASKFARSLKDISDTELGVSFVQVCSNFLFVFYLTVLSIIVYCIDFRVHFVTRVYPTAWKLSCNLVYLIVCSSSKNVWNWSRIYNIIIDNTFIPHKTCLVIMQFLLS